VSRRPEVPVHLKAGLSVAEAAAMSGESESSIRRLVREGVLARAPYTGRVIIARAELDRWLMSGRVDPARTEMVRGAA
jgi:transposase